MTKKSDFLNALCDLCVTRMVRFRLKNIFVNDKINVIYKQKYVIK